jgi:dienelactone hydrolase
MRKLVPATVGVLLVLAPARPALADRAFSQKGPLSVEVKMLEGSVGSTELVVPTSGGPYPLIVASHGWAGSGENQVGWARHFASYGFVVAVPSFPTPFSPNHSANATRIGTLVTDLTGPLAATHGVMPGAVGLEGHSAGGLATSLAAAAIAPQATVLFDPVDRDDLGKTALASVCSPILALFAQPGSCNAQAGWKAFATAAKGEVLGFDVVGSTHCDGENAPRPLCGGFCGGGASPNRQDVYAHYATAFFLARLKGQADAGAALAGSALSGDEAIANVVSKADACQESPGDGGASSGGSSGSSGSSGSGAPSTEPSEPPGEAVETAGDADPSASEGGCGCRVLGADSRSSGMPGGAAGLGLGLAALAAVRRRKAHARG